jgi:hypothetical protein
LRRSVRQRHPDGHPRHQGARRGANTIVIPGPIYDVIRQSADVIAFIAGAINPSAHCRRGQSAKGLRPKRHHARLVPDGYVNQSDTGFPPTVINPIWPDDLRVGRSCKPGALRGGGFGRTFYWDKQGPLFQLYSYRDEVKA